jgi:hypothetical protein
LGLIGRFAIFNHSKQERERERERERDYKLVGNSVKCKTKICFKKKAKQNKNKQTKNIYPYSLQCVW